MLSQQRKPYRDGAERAFRLTLEQGKHAGIEEEWTARARSPLVEFGGAPTAATPLFAPAANPNPPPAAVPPRS